MTNPVTLTDAEREALATRLVDICKAQAMLTEAMLPFSSAYQVLQEIHDGLIDHLPEIAGYCETCSRMLFEGEQGFRYEDGPILCAEHAPTWADIKRDAQDAAEADAAFHRDLDDDDLEARRALLAQCAEHEAAGTSGEKYLHTL